MVSRGFVAFREVRVDPRGTPVGVPWDPWISITSAPLIAGKSPGQI